MKRMYEKPVMTVSTFKPAQIVTYSLGDGDFKDEWDEEDTGAE